ncbi:hypothetical protein Esti_005249 [Eimeria stiedai]
MPSCLGLQNRGHGALAFDSDGSWPSGLPAQSAVSNNYGKPSQAESSGGLRLGFLECHICLLCKDADAHSTVPSAQASKVHCQSKSACSDQVYRLFACKAPCAFIETPKQCTEVTGNGAFVVLKPPSSGLGDDSLPLPSGVCTRWWRVTSVADSGSPSLATKGKEFARSSASHDRAGEPFWQDVINRVAHWVAVEQLNATVLVLGGKTTRYRDHEDRAQTKSSPFQWMPCVAQRTCAEIFSLFRTRGNYSVRTRVSCWLATNQGAVDLLSPHCRLLNPSCPGCFFALPSAADHGNSSSAREDPKSVSSSPPTSIFEACKLIQMAKEKLQDIRRNFVDAPTLFVRLHFVQHHGGTQNNSTLGTGSPVLHVVFFGGSPKNPPPTVTASSLHGAAKGKPKAFQSARCWEDRGSLSVLCAVLRGLSTNKPESRIHSSTPAACSSITERRNCEDVFDTRQKMRASPEFPLYMHKPNCLFSSQLLERVNLPCSNNICCQGKSELPVKDTPCGDVKREFNCFDIQQRTAFEVVAAASDNSSWAWNEAELTESPLLERSDSGRSIPSCRMQRSDLPPQAQRDTWGGSEEESPYNHFVAFLNHHSKSNGENKKACNEENILGNSRSQGEHRTKEQFRESTTHCVRARQQPMPAQDQDIFCLPFKRHERLYKGAVDSEGSHPQQANSRTAKLTKEETLQKAEQRGRPDAGAEAAELTDVRLTPISKTGVKLAIVQGRGQECRQHTR